MRVDDELAILFYIVKYGHLLSADDDQPLLFERMKPAYKDVCLHAALKLARCKGRVINLRIDVRTARCRNAGWHLIQKVKDGGYIMRSKAPQDGFLRA